MSAAQFVNELEEMPVEARQQVVRSVLAKLYPRSAKAIERLLRRIEHLEVPDDMWEGFEEVAQPKFWKNYRKLSASQQQSARTLGNSCERASGLTHR